MVTTLCKQCYIKTWYGSVWKSNYKEITYRGKARGRTSPSSTPLNTKQNPYNFPRCSEKEIRVDYTVAAISRLSDEIVLRSRPIWRHTWNPVSACPALGLCRDSGRRDMYSVQALVQTEEYGDMVKKKNRVLAIFTSEQRFGKTHLPFSSSQAATKLISKKSISLPGIRHLKWGKRRLCSHDNCWCAWHACIIENETAKSTYSTSSSNI